MEYLKAWIFLQHKLRDKGEEIDETLLKYVEKLYNELNGLLATGFVKKTKTGNFEMAALADAQVENRLLKDALEFYGDKKHWSEPYTRQGKTGFQVKAPLHIDGGEKARTTLEKTNVNI